MRDLDEFWRKIKETTPENLAALSDEALQQHFQYFLNAHHKLGAGNHKEIRAAEMRIPVLQNDLSLRSTKAQSASLHKETMSVDSKTLFWARLAVVAAIVVPLIVALVSEFPSSKPRLSKPETAFLT